MTSLPVNDIGILTPMTNEAGGATPTAKADHDFMGSFKNALETQATALNMIPSDQAQAVSRPQTTERIDREVEQVDRPADSGRTDGQRESVKNEVKKQTGNETGEDTAKDTDQVEPETAATIAEAMSEIVNEVSQELDVAPEDVLAALDELNLSTKDLLDPANMSDIITQIAGDQDALSLLTDENLYQTLTDLQEFVSDVDADLRSKLDLSQEALNEVLGQTEELDGQAIAEMITGKVQAESAGQAEEAAGSKDYKVTTTISGERVTIDVDVDASTGVASTAGVTKSEPDSHSGDPSNDSGRGKENRSHLHGSEITQTTQFNTVIDNTEVFETDAAQVQGFRTEASDIANQIMDSMRANISEDVTELEMNLHPASLGNVRVNLVAQNGQITAQFIAQNETVRAAIESQVMQLRESLESQGIKIEAVEVTLASHEFDRGSDSAGQHQDEMAREEARARLGGRRRSIDLSAITDESELADMEEADRIAAQMMASEGNTVDYRT